VFGMEVEGWLEYKDKTAFGSHPWKKRWVKLHVEEGTLTISKGPDVPPKDKPNSRIKLYNTRVDIVPSEVKTEHVFCVCKIDEYFSPSESVKISSNQYKGVSGSFRKLAQRSLSKSEPPSPDANGQTLLSPRSMGKSRIHRFRTSEESDMIRWVNSIAHSCALHINEEEVPPLLSPRARGETKNELPILVTHKALPKPSPEQKSQKQTEAALMIQALWRYVLVRREFRDMILGYRAARLIQSAWRMNSRRTWFLTLVKEARYRKRVQQELLSTERTYVSGLNTLVNVFINPLTNSGILAGPQIVTLFSNVQSLVKLHTYLVGELETRLAEGRYFDYTTIGDIFAFVLQQFKLYTEYINNYDNAVKLLIKLKASNSKFKAYLEKSHTMPELNSLPLEGFLIMPVQRLPRIEMLLKDLLRHTWDEHPDHQAISDAFQAISTLTAFVNERKREAENSTRIADVQRRIKKGSTMDRIIEPHRKWLKQGELELKTKNKSIKRAVILFSDMVMCATQKSVLAITKGLHHTVRYDTVDVYYFDDTSTVSLCDPNGFILITTAAECALFASSPEEQQEWYTAISNAIAGLARSNLTSRSTSALMNNSITHL